MNAKEVEHNEPYTIEPYFNEEEDEDMEKFSESSFLQVHSVYSESKTHENYLEEEKHFRSTTSKNYDKNSLIVENLCNQIKYLIEGNLKNGQLSLDMEDVVRDNIIPMLIKMFFQQSSTDKKTGFFGSKQMSSTFESKNRDNSEKVSGSQNWQNNSAEYFRLTQINRNPFPKSLYFTEQQKNQKEIFSSELPAEDKENMVEIDNLNIQLPKILFLTILLLKCQIIKKSYCFEKLKVFSKTKEKLINQFIHIFNAHRLKNTIKKFQENLIFVKKLNHESSLKLQTEIFKKKTVSLSCQIIFKIIRQKISKMFGLFKENSFRENKWMRQWIRMAALKSPVTVKTSIWRLKNFMENEQQTNESKQSTKRLEPSIKEIIIAQEREILNKASSHEVSKKSYKISQDNISEKESSEQTITSGEFDAMFENESSEPIIESEQKITRNNNEKIAQNAPEDNMFRKEQHQQRESDGYLNTISEDENEISSVCD